MFFETKKLKSKFSIFVSFLMSLTIIFSININSSKIVQAAQKNNIYYTGSYYESLGGLDKLLDGSYSKTDVEEGLRALIGYSKTGTFSSQPSDKYIKAFGKTISGTDNKHPKYGGTAGGSLAYLWQSSERKESDEKPEGYFRLFYSKTYGNSLSNYASSIVNREHVWPQSLSGGLFGTTGGGADLHHVRPANGKLNNVRSNKPYADLNSNQITSTYYTTGSEYSSFNSIAKYVSGEDIKDKYNGVLTGYATSSYFEPTDDYKGDISRIFAYLIVHYPSLEKLLNNVLIGGTKTLVKWNKLDPVDSYEIQKNNVAYNYQGNRNPFIDAPQLIDEIWGDGTTYPGDENPTKPDKPSEGGDNENPQNPSVSNEYKLVTDASQITDGSEVIVTGINRGITYALSNDNSIAGALKGKNIELNKETINTDDDSLKWQVKKSAGGITLKSKSKDNSYIFCASASGAKLGLSKIPTVFSVGSYGKKAGLYLTSKSGRGILFNNSLKAFKNYSLTNLGGSSYASAMNIYIKVS